MSEVRLNVGDDYIGSAFSPVVSIEDVEEGHEVVITDYSGDHSYIVPDWSEEEDGRVANEQARQAAEAARASAETARAAAETSRASAESARASAETSRASAESARATAENGRVSAESARATAEQGRASAEAARVESSAAAVAAANNAANSATSAASAASSATTRATEAAEAAEGIVMDDVPLMSANIRGGAKLGAGLAIVNGALELDGSGDIATAVSSWLDAHPEATTTVQDGSITDAKLVQTGGVLSEVEDIRTGYNGYAYASAGNAVRATGDAIDSLSKYKNLYDPNDPDSLIGGYENSQGYNAVGEMGQTQYIPVEQGYTYTKIPVLSDSYPFILYNSNKEWIGGANPVNGAVTINNPNCAYVRPILRISLLNDISEFKLISNNESDIQPDVGIDDLDFTEKINLFNINGANTIGGYYNESGTYTANSAICQTGYIEVKPNVIYYPSHADGFVLEYDASKNVLRKYSNNELINNKCIKAGSNAKFMKFVIATTHYMDFYVYSTDPNDVKIPTDVLNGELTSLYDGKAGVAFGTSLTYRSETVGGYLNRLEPLSGITFENQGEGSCGFIHIGIQNSNITNRIMAYPSYADKDVVIIEGTVNDWYTSEPLGTYTDSGTATVCGCLRECIKHILTQKPSMQIFVILDHYGASSGTVSTATINGHTQMTYYDELAKVCASLGIPCFKGYAESGMSELTPYMFADNIHLSRYGYIHFGNNVWDFMKQYTPKVGE